MVGLIISDSIAEDIDRGHLLPSLTILHSRIKTILFRHLFLTIFYAIIITIPLIVNLFILPLTIYMPIITVIYIHYFTISLIASSIAIITRKPMLASTLLILILYSPLVPAIFGTPYGDKTMQAYFLGILPSTGLFGLAEAYIGTIPIQEFYTAIIISLSLSSILYIIVIASILRKLDLVI
jgi:hypothetical protein